MICPACNADSHPVIDIQADGRAVNMCPACSAVLGAATTGNVPRAAAKAGPAAPEHSPPAGTPGDAVAHVRARLVAVEAELSRLEDLTREAAQLRAMIRAVDGPTPRRAAVKAPRLRAVSGGKRPL